MKPFVIVFTAAILLLSCDKEKKYQYELTGVTVSQNGGGKTTPKSTTEFISIAYSDLFNTTIPQSRLVNLSVAYASFGDLKVIEDKIIRNFLNDTAAVIPAQVSENGDTSLFISKTYNRFFNRDPNEYEKYFWKNLIRDDASITPVVVYYAMMTSDEYRFY
ncbi:MAG: hypothetical protein IT242_06025 [Bacteroidia bacterium]|nr:hypothetical protein [Bacteroidia bacterium]